MSVDLNDDITARTLLKGFLASEVPKSTVRHHHKRRSSELERLSLQNEIGTSSNVKNINLLSPSMTLRGRMKEKIRRSMDNATGSAKRSFPDKCLPKKHHPALPSQYDMDKDTPRTILKNIIQTQSEVSLVVMERPQDEKREQTREEPDAKATLLGLDKLEMNVLEPPVHRSASGLSRIRKKTKRVSVSQFERGVEETLPQIREREDRLEEHNENIVELANNSAVSRFRKTSLSIPSMPESIEKRGMVRRPKKHRIIHVEDFEEGINKNFIHLKGSQNCFVESMVTGTDGSMLPSSVLQINTEIILSNTELFVKSLPKDQTLLELSQPRSPSLFSTSKQSLKSSSVYKGDIGNQEMASIDGLEPLIKIQREMDTMKDATQLKSVEGEIEEESYRNMDLEKSSLIEGSEKRKEGSYSAVNVEKTTIVIEVEESSNSPENTEKEVGLTKGVEKGLEQMDRVISMVSNGIESSQSYRNFRMSLPGTEKLDSVFERSEEPIEVSDHALASFPLLIDKASRASINKTVGSVLLGSEVGAETEENNVLPANSRRQEEVVVKELSEEEELSEVEQITRSAGFLTAAPQNSAVSMKAAPFNMSELSGRISTPYSAKTSMNVAAAYTHSAVEREVESNQKGSLSHDEEEEVQEKQLTEDEGAESEDISMDKNVFLRIKDIKFSSSLTTPHYLKTRSSKFPKKPSFAKRAPRRTDRAPPRMKKEPAIPSRLVKQIFAHYAKMSVAKESFKVVEKCLDVYFKQLSNDLEVFAGHAKRKTVDATDIELLMRRQGLVTDKMPLHILIERHLPLEYRRLLIPVAMSGNKVIPKK